MTYRVINDAKDRAFKATHLCELPDPEPWMEAALIECEECGQMWSKHVEWLSHRPYWDGIRGYPMKSGLVHWRGYAGQPPFNYEDRPRKWWRRSL
jgi:hypothetical protein